MTAVAIPSIRRPLLLAAILVAAGSVATCCMAADDVRLGVQAEAGTSGFEPGIALEWRPSGIESVIARPEAFISEDGRLGAGGAVLYDLGTQVNMPARQALAIGPRAVYHNADDEGWEVDAMATWAYQLQAGDRNWRHAIGLIGALGVLHDRKHDDNKVGATGGIFYTYRLF